MKRYIVLSAFTFLIVSTSVYWALTLSNRHAAREEHASEEVYRLLRREAELVEYFCLSRIPPLLGTATIVSEWEKALGSRVRLREGAGEITSEAPELAARVSEIQNLDIGESMAVTSANGGRAQHWLVYRPTQASNQLLVLSKLSDTAKQQLDQNKRLHPAFLSLLIGFVVALIQGAAARLVFPPIRKV